MQFTTNMHTGLFMQFATNMHTGLFNEHAYGFVHAVCNEHAYGFVHVYVRKIDVTSMPIIHSTKMHRDCAKALHVREIVSECVCVCMSTFVRISDDRTAYRSRSCCMSRTFFCSLRFEVHSSAWVHRRCKKGRGASTSVTCRAGQIYRWTFVCWLVLAASPLSCVRVRSRSPLCCTTMLTALDPGVLSAS